MQYSWRDALSQASVNKASCRFPTKSDDRFGDVVLPIVSPRFRIDRERPIFTIGSCFAREIEEKLQGFDLPTRSFSAPPTEWPHRPSGLLNEYNPGTIAQRIKWALGHGKEPDDTIVSVARLVADLLLPGGASVTEERAFERRREIQGVYAHLPASGVVIITLGLIECWVDQETGTYLNRMPPLDVLKKTQDRYAFRVLGISDTMGLLTPVFEALADNGTNVLLTVSPVPLQTTFSGADAVIANSHSKSVLRVCAQELYQKFPLVDYFPSYEIATTTGLDAFGKDNVHVKPEVVNSITNYMLKSYLVPQSEVAYA